MRVFVKPNPDFFDAASVNHQGAGNALTRPLRLAPHAAVVPKVRDAATGKPIAADGAFVQLSTYIQRQINSGALIVVDPPKRKSAAKQTKTQE